jgi:predicted enzyme related to lactoylglutathione lyase
MTQNPVCWFEIYVQDMDRAVEFGGSIQRGKMSIGEYGFISLVYDTEGNMFGLHSVQ